MYGVDSLFPITPSQCNVFVFKSAYFFSSLRSRRSQYIFCHVEQVSRLIAIRNILTGRLIVSFLCQFRPHCYVFLLYDCCNGPTIPKVHLVEKVLDQFPNGAIHCDFRPSIPIAVQRMQLSKGIHGLDCFAWRHVLGLIL